MVKIRKSLLNLFLWHNFHSFFLLILFLKLLPALNVILLYCLFLVYFLILGYFFLIALLPVLYLHKTLTAASYLYILNNLIIVLVVFLFLFGYSSQKRFILLIIILCNNCILIYKALYCFYYWILYFCNFYCICWGTR